MCGDQAIRQSCRRLDIWDEDEKEGIDDRWERTTNSVSASV
jgi:hypothetical protein